MYLENVAMAPPNLIGNGDIESSKHTEENENHELTVPQPKIFLVFDQVNMIMATL